MTSKTEQLDLDRLEALARAATPQNLDSAQDATKPTGYIECPECCGDGTVELTADYCNYDGKAMGVQFYGIGPEHQAAEAFFRAANPAAVLALIALARRPPVPAARPTDDELWDSTIRDRDTYQEWADKLADAIAVHFGVDIGEHSNQNCPWHEALEAIESAAPARRAQPEGEAPEPDWISAVVLSVAELPDRDSPEEWPEAMLVTGDELRNIITAFAPAAQHAENGAPEANAASNPYAAPSWDHEYSPDDDADDEVAAQSQGAQAAQLGIGFANNDQGVHVSVIQQHADGNFTVLHQGRVPAGDSFARFALAAKAEAPADPLDTPLPCDIKVGACTMRKGVKLRTLVTRMEGLHRMAMEAQSDPTPEQRAEFEKLFPLAAQQAAAPGSLAAEAAKLAPILRGMCEGGDVHGGGVDIYADDYMAGDGDTYVVRAAALLEQIAAAPSSPGTPEAPAELPRLYRFDCYVGKTKMAAGVGVHATSMTEAEEKAKKLADKNETIKFESNRPCHATRKCSICAEYERAAQLDGGQGGSESNG